MSRMTVDEVGAKLREAGIHPMAKVTTGEYKGFASDWCVSISQVFSDYRALVAAVQQAGFIVSGWSEGTGTPHDSVTFNEQ